MGGAQRRGVVEPVAHHQHAAALGRPVLQKPQLLARRQVAMPPADPGRLADGVHMRALVTGQDRQVQPQAAQRSGCVGHVGTRAVAEAETMHRVADPQQDAVLARGRTGPFRTPQPDGRAIEGALHAEARHLADLRDLRRCDAERLGLGYDRLREWMERPGGQRRRDRPGRRVLGRGLDQLRLAIGERPGLVEGHQIDLGQALELGAVLQEDACPEQPRGRDRMDGGNRQR